VMMKVVISVHGRFWAFYLAQQMLRFGVLSRLITSYPKFEVIKYGIPRPMITSLPSNEVLARAWRKLPEILKSKWNPQAFLKERFDRFAASSLQEGPNVFVGWSSNSLGALRRAKALGMIGIIERGSSHMLYQQDILTEEYSRFGLPTNHTHPRVIEKELMEYQEADYIAIPSTYVKRTFIQHGVPEAKLIHVPYGVDLDDFYPVPKEDNTFRIMHCGGLTLRKGVHYLLQAFHELKLPDAELWLVGAVGKEIEPIPSTFFPAVS